jgi:chemotaxis protein histidine kinase CheA/CheY-like chemotaxis protein
VKIFVAETADRSARLVGAAGSGIEGVDRGTAGTAARDAHTLKGNFAMLGYDVLSDAAAALEQAWTRIGSGDIELDDALASRLSALAAALLPALEHGESTLGPACRAVCGTLGRSCRFDDTTPGPKNDTFYSLATDRPDLDGLLARTRGLVLGDAVRVDSGRLYEVINRAVEVRLDIDALVDALKAEVGEGAWTAAAESLRDAVAALQTEAAVLATGPLSEVTRTLGQLVRYIANRTGKKVRFDVVGDDIEVDRQLLDVLREPLRHLVVNAIDHGCERPEDRVAVGKPEVAEIRLSFLADGSTLRVMVGDDGTGVDWDEVEAAGRKARLLTTDGIPSRTDLEHLLVAHGLSTGGSGDGFSGDGVGLALVAKLVDKVHGGMRIDSLPGAGTRVSISLPSSLALQDVLLVRCAGMRWGVPRAAVVDVVEFEPSALCVDEWDIEYRVGDVTVPFVSLSQLLGRAGDEPSREVVVATTKAGLVGLGVPAVLSSRLVAVKRLGGVLAGNEFLAGAALLGGGDMVMVVEPNGIETVGLGAGQDRPLVVVVDDSRAVRQLLSATLASAGFDVEAVADRRSLLAVLDRRSAEAVVVDFHLDEDDGVSLAAAVADAYPDLPVVMLSGVAGESEKRAAREAGVRGVFEKAGVGDGTFVDAIRSLIGRTQQAVDA